jgi:hypothetical protein
MLANKTVTYGDIQEQISRGGAAQNARCENVTDAVGLIFKLRDLCASYRALNVQSKRG